MAVAIDKKINILIVDDFMTTLKVMGSILRQFGFTNIDEAASGKEALEKIEIKSYDIVLSDWNMAPMDGLELLKAVRANPRTKNMPFILITAETKLDNIVAAKKAGVSNYIVKPIAAATLKEKMSAVLGGIIV